MSQGGYGTSSLGRTQYPSVGRAQPQPYGQPYGAPAYASTSPNYGQAKGGQGQSMSPLPAPAFGGNGPAPMGGIQPPRNMDTSPLFGSPFTGYNPAPAQPTASRPSGRAAGTYYGEQQPASFWFGNGTSIPQGADPAAVNPVLAAQAATNPMLASYLRSGLPANSPVFSQPGAQPGSSGLARGSSLPFLYTGR